MSRPVRRALVPVVVGFLLLLLVAAGVLVFHYVPFEATSFAAWIGIAVAVVSLLCVISPPRFLGIRSRQRSALVLVLGAALAITALLWPVSIVRATGPRQRLDDFLPEYQFREYHETVVQAPVERVIEAARGVSLADMPVAVWLMRVRALAGGHVSKGTPDPRPILDMTARPRTGFLRLDVSNPRELVYGMVGQPWTNRPGRAGSPSPRILTPEEFQAFTAPGQIRVAFNIRIVDEGQGRVRLSTETRTLGNDAEAQRVFARYWRIIYPGSAIIRRVWLDAIVARAVRPASRS
jgi:hypothetical protein